VSDEYVSLEEARQLSGLRLVSIRGVPSPWTQAARAILRVKGLDFTLAQQTPDDPPGLLQEWTGQTSFPVLAFNQEPTRSGWAEILLLAERLSPQPAGIPSDPAARAAFFGLAHEICGEMGLGWCRRLQSIAAGMQGERPSPVAAYLGPKYGYSPESAAHALQRVIEVLTLLRDRLAAQEAAGSRYLMGSDLTALDLYWATFCNLVSPLPPDKLPLDDAMRPIFTSTEPEVIALLEGRLLEHRDRIYDEFLELPVPL